MCVLFTSCWETAAYGISAPPSPLPLPPPFCAGSLDATIHRVDQTCQNERSLAYILLSGGSDVALEHEMNGSSGVQSSMHIHKRTLGLPKSAAITVESFACKWIPKQSTK